MTDCSSIHGSTTSSSDIISSRGITTTNPRIRVIRMIRPSSRRVLLGPDNNSVFGFAIRGGKEFGTGFFISNVEKGSEADIKGLRIGDQIIRANGYYVDDAIHKELTQFISSQDRLTLKVRGVGMLPVKEKIIDPLSWHIVPRYTLNYLTSLEEMRIPQKDVRIVLKVAPRTKLGLGICKGPEWKPGIFVQFTKEFSVARDAGLRPGDQILSCNSIDFSDVLFSEAVAVMKSSQILEMIVRTGAGLDLFPGESSGYNSSASSVTGDQSPCWGDHSSKRLSIVREENCFDKIGMQSKYWHDRNSLCRRKNYSIFNARESNNRNESHENKTIIQLSENGTLINNTLISDTNRSGMGNLKSRRQHNNSSSCCSTASSSSIDGNSNKLNFITPNHVTQSNCIDNNKSMNNNNTGDADTTNNDVVSNQTNNGKIADICFVSRQSETKTVIVEVHRSAVPEETNKPELSSSSLSSLSSSPVTSAPVPPPKPPPPTSSLSSSPSNSNNTDINERSPSVASSCRTTTSLSSAISEELKKRQERRNANRDTNHNGENHEKRSDIETQLRHQSTLKRFGNPSLGGNDVERRHSALMDEFKNLFERQAELNKVHRKILKNGFQENKAQERQAELNKSLIKKDETDNNAQNTGNFKTEDDNTNFPIPPPPPPQFANNIESKKLQILNSISQNKLKSPAETPTPDYDSTPTHTLTKNSGFNLNKNGFITNGNNSVAKTIKDSTLGRVIANEAAKVNGDVAEVESIESFKLQSSTSKIPKPPSLYFAPQNSGPPTMKKTTNRNVSVTIGEYGGQNFRKEPSKLDFISKINENNINLKNNPQNNNNNYNNRGENEIIKNDDVSEKLRSELVKTLSRSNLKKRNDFETKFDNNNECLIPNGKISNSNTKNRFSNGNVEKLANMLQNRQKLFENNVGMNNPQNKSATIKSANKVTISVPSNKQDMRKTIDNNASASTASNTPTNGILKNCYAKSSNFTEKSITFGN